MSGEARPVRVLYVFGSLDPKTGGPANSAPNIWISAARAGIAGASAFTVEDPLPEGEARTMRRLGEAGIELHPFTVSGVRQLRRWGVSLPLALWVVRNARHYDLVHAHGAWMVSSLVGFVAARLSGTRFVLTPHEHLTDSDVAKGKSRLRHRVKALFRRIYLRWTDLIVVASAIEGRASVRAGAKAKTAVIYHPVIADPASLPPPRTPADGAAPLRVGFLGRFDPKKRLELIIAAVGATPGTALHVAGGGDDDYERRLRALARESRAEGRTEWHGFLSAAALPKFFASIDVLAMPSSFEGFGMVAAEAMSHGVPVIVSGSTGIGELVERHGGGLVIEATVPGLSTAFGRLGDDRATLARLSGEAIALCRRELSFESYGATLAESYRALLGRGSRSEAALAAASRASDAAENRSSIR
jgi:glycosyltransferase involved in cell wall biosynthesis